MQKASKISLSIKPTIFYNRDPNSEYGGGAEEESILNSIKEWTKGAATYIRNISNTMENTIAPDLKVEIF